MFSFHYPPVDAASIRGGCCLTSIGELSYAPGVPYPSGGHPREFDFRWAKGRVIPDFALVFITSGEGEWQVRGRCSKVRKGDALYLVPGGWHRYRPSAAEGWVEKWLCLRGGTLHGFVAAGILPATCLHISGGILKDAEQRLDRLRQDALADPVRNQPSWGARGLAVVLECFEGTRREDSLPISSLTDRALRYIHENAHRPLHVGDVSSACGVERRTLERHFAASGRSSIAQSIVAERVARAGMLLKETDLQIKEIAYACGFGNVQRMIYDFHRHRGMTPGQTRLAENRETD